MRTLALALVVAGCTPSASVTVHHPAQPGAPTGRLAGPPAALRAGVAADVPAPEPAVKPPEHHHH